MSNAPLKWIFPAPQCRRFTKARGARLRHALSMGSRCKSQGEITASVEVRRQPTVAAAVGTQKQIQKNITNTEEISL